VGAAYLKGLGAHTTHLHPLPSSQHISNPYKYIQLLRNIVLISVMESMLIHLYRIKTEVSVGMETMDNKVFSQKWGHRKRKLSG